MSEEVRQIGRQLVETEADAVRAMVRAVEDESFERAVSLIADCPCSVLTSGIGKAGHVARKISATFASTGTPSHFLSPTDAVHGDLGSVRKGDVIVSIAGKSNRMRESDLFAFLVNRAVGEKVPVGVLRGAERIELILLMQK